MLALNATDLGQSGSNVWARQFEAVRVGMYEERVASLLGPPDREAGDKWICIRPKELRPGVQQTMFILIFKRKSVTAKQIVSGPDATGPAPRP